MKEGELDEARLKGVACRRVNKYGARESKSRSLEKPLTERYKSALSSREFLLSTGISSIGIFTSSQAGKCSGKQQLFVFSSGLAVELSYKLQSKADF